MRFHSDKERNSHKLASLIPNSIWKGYFANNAIDERLLELMAIEDEGVLLSKAGDIPLQNRTEDFLLSIICSHQNISPKTFISIIEMIAIAPNDIILVLATYGNIQFLEIALQHFKNESMLMIEAFNCAACHGHVDILKYLEIKMQSPTLLENIIQEDNYYKFREAAANGHITVIQYLAEKLPSKLQDMIDANNYAAFCLAAKSGHIDVLEYLGKKSPNKLQDMILVDDYEAFRKAAENGHIKVLQYLEDKTQDRIALHNMIKQNQHRLFQFIAENGHVAVLQYLEEKFQCSNNDQTFWIAANRGDTDLLLYIEKKIKPLTAIKDMIKANNYAVFHSDQAKTLNFLMRYSIVRNNACDLMALYHSFSNNNRIWIRSSYEDIKELLKHPAIFQYMCSHYIDDIKPFIIEKIKELKERSLHGNPPRLLHNKQEAECLFYILHYLINVVGIAAKDDILFILRIPELHALLPTARLPYNITNLALRATACNMYSAIEDEAVNWGEIIQAFYIIPEVHAQADFDGHYKAETHDQLDLCAIASNRESSMRAATPKELEQPDLVYLDLVQLDFLTPKQAQCNYNDLPDWYLELMQEENKRFAYLNLTEHSLFQPQAQPSILGEANFVPCVYKM